MHVGALSGYFARSNAPNKTPKAMTVKTITGKMGTVTNF